MVGSFRRFRFNTQARAWFSYIVGLALGKLDIMMLHIKVFGDDRTLFGRMLRKDQKYSER